MRYVLLLVLLVYTGCQQTRFDSGAPGETGRLLEPSDRLMAPDFRLPAIAGDSIALSSLHGRVVVLNFWATWCVPCLEEMPELERFHNTTANDGVSVVGVSMDTEGPIVVNHFIRRLGVTYPVVLADSELADAYQGLTDLPTKFAALNQSPSLDSADQAKLHGAALNVLQALPTTFLIDRQGRIAAYLVGLLQMEALKASVSRLVSEPHG